MSHEFQYDHVFTEKDDQLTVFDVVARPAVKDIMDGYNSAIITYRQTASGKTYALQGDDTDRPEGQEIVPRTAVELFNFVSIMVMQSWAKKINNEGVRNELKSTDDFMDIVTMLQKDLQLEKNRVDLLKSRLECSAPPENVPASSDQGRSVMRSTPTSDETAMSSEVCTIEAMQQLQKKFKKLEEDYLKVQLESYRRGLNIQDLEAQLDSKA
ncbi:unnamed protein product [Albugo candida]|uniref:Kinesin motor domain-containing protein n=1 Tax=Albugo candida TaxID=65357 RepID=A0A024GHQ8_9STRA|nr:unnamed protein product [Albugo candida]|eukprot:CCI46251.1 unnamed protein product [Albugo candida]